MLNIRFEAYKVRRELKRSGTDYKFERAKRNEFGEPTDSLEVVGTLKGLYHEQNGSVQIVTGDTTQTRTKKIPMIFCLYEEAVSLVLQIGDTVKMNGKTFKVTGVVNVQEWNLVSDISLEVVDNGVRA